MSREITRTVAILGTPAATSIAAAAGNVLSSPAASPLLPLSIIDAGLEGADGRDKGDPGTEPCSGKAADRASSRSAWRLSIRFVTFRPSLVDRAWCLLSACIRCARPPYPPPGDPGSPLPDRGSLTDRESPTDTPDPRRKPPSIGGAAAAEDGPVTPNRAPEPAAVLLCRDSPTRLPRLPPGPLPADAPASADPVLAYTPASAPGISVAEPPDRRPPEARPCEEPAQLPGFDRLLRLREARLGTTGALRGSTNGSLLRWGPDPAAGRPSERRGIAEASRSANPPATLDTAAGVKPVDITESLVAATADGDGDGVTRNADRPRNGTTLAPPCPTPSPSAALLVGINSCAARPCALSTSRRAGAPARLTAPEPAASAEPAARPESGSSQRANGVRRTVRVEALVVIAVVRTGCCGFCGDGSAGRHAPAALAPPAGPKLTPTAAAAAD